MEKILQDIKEILGREGIYLFGFCGIGDIKDAFLFKDKTVLNNINYAVSIAHRLSWKILEEITDEPTALYAFHYKRVNSLLDMAALKVSSYIQEKGFNAIPIPASQIIDWQQQRASLSHKHVAVKAGLGWLGRNNLVVHPRHGSQLRFATILTDIVLPESEPLHRDCGTCALCLSACPAGAIRKTQEEFDHKSCYHALKEFSKKQGITQYICGICIKACNFSGAGNGNTDKT
ncbi:MAG: 4Fe-4S double cluster binding domain-containing protein [Candidatus Omnitrophota bacterium]